MSDVRIVKTPGVCGGSACIAGTRIPVWTLARYRQLGAGDGELLGWYPALTPASLAAAWAYVAAHPDEIEADILDNDDAMKEAP